MITFKQYLLTEVLRKDLDALQNRIRRELYLVIGVPERDVSVNTWLDTNGVRLVVNVTVKPEEDVKLIKAIMARIAQKHIKDILKDITVVDMDVSDKRVSPTQVHIQRMYSINSHLEDRK